MKKVLVVIAVLVALIVASVAQAGTRGNSGVTVSGPLDPTTLTAVSPAYGDTVAFDVEGVTAAQYPWLKIRCYQGSTEVYSVGANLTGSGVSEFTLTSQVSEFWGPWDGNPATCTATVQILNGGKEHKLVASTDFNVS